jgi:hypothetical protein
MAHGIEVYDASGNLRLSMTHTLIRFIFHQAVAAGASGSASDSGIVAANCVGFAVPQSDVAFILPHTVTLIDGQVSWTAPASLSVPCDIYVIRHQ